MGTGIRYDGPIILTGTTTVKSRSFRHGCQESEVREDTYRIYAQKVTNDAPISLSGDEVMEITNTYYVHGNDILLSDNAQPGNQGLIVGPPEGLYVPISATSHRQ